MPKRNKILKKHHKIQTKRSNKPIEDKEKNEKFDEIRRKTLERLRKYKLRSLLHKDFGSEDVNDGEEELPLPPYPQNNSQQFSGDFPLPPPPICSDLIETSNDCIPLPPNTSLPPLPTTAS